MMKIRVADHRSTCTTLILHNLYGSAGIESFKSRARNAVQKFDDREGSFFDVYLEDMDDEYEWPVEEHGCIIATTDETQKNLHEALKSSGFSIVGVTHPSKTNSELTFWYATVKDFLKGIKEQV